MKMTDIIQRLLEHPDAEAVLRRVEDRLATECATPDISGVLTAYLAGDVREMFHAFTGWSMENFLTITNIIPDHGNLAGIPKENALFQDAALDCIVEAQ